MNLSDIPTPLTDAFALAVHEGQCLPTCDSFGHDEKCPVCYGEDLLADFARDLERKLTGAIAEQNRLNEYYQYEAIKLRHTTEERDEAKRKLAEADADAKASEMMLRQVCEERDALRTYAGSQTFRSDFRTADELRAAYDEERRKNAVLREALKDLLEDVQDYQRINNLGGENNHSQVRARAALTTTEEKV